MLSAEDNEILTRVGPGTPMGNLLRRYWIPACLSSEIAEPDGPPVRVRLLCEDLVAFRDTNGRIGLIAEGKHELQIFILRQGSYDSVEDINPAVQNRPH